MRTVMVRLLTIMALAALGALLIAPSAFALPHAEEAAFTNPVAYELKSLLTTHFYVKLDTDNVWATLDILAADGSVVKTVYSGPTGRAGVRYYFPYWNGLDKNGRRLPSANYRWRLQLAQGNQRNYYYGNITVSKINFFMKGSGLPGGSTSDLTVSQQFNRYMIPGNANIYMQVWETDSSVNGARLTADLVYPVDHQYPEAFSYLVANDTVLNATAYLRGAKAIRYRGVHNWWLECPNATYYMTVIQ